MNEIKEKEILNIIFQILKEETSTTEFLKGIGMNEATINNVKNIQENNFKEWSQKIYQGIKKFIV